jgi:epoxyqueuosine reductase
MHNYIKKSALSLGFDACGIAKADVLTEDAVFFKEWLANENHAEMHYLERNFEKRIDPRVLVPGCKSVVAVLLNYFPAVGQPENSPRIARYAYSATDYHTVLKLKLAQLETQIVNRYGENVVNEAAQHSFVDSAPVLERRWAQRAGLGWIGKHTQLIAPDLGSYFFIGILLLNVEMNYDVPIKDRCGTCTRCVDACPTSALIPGTLDARRCISYQTIEKKTTIDAEIKPLLSGFALGCDICAEVCPWNKKWAIPHVHEELNAVPEVTEWMQDDWNEMGKADFDRIFKNSAIKRAGFDKFRENLSFLSKKNATFE